MLTQRLDTKALRFGDGGAIVTNDDGVAKRKNALVLREDKNVILEDDRSDLGLSADHRPQHCHAFLSIETG